MYTKCTTLRDRKRLLLTARFLLHLQSTTPSQFMALSLNDSSFAVLFRSFLPPLPRYIHNVCHFSASLPLTFEITFASLLPQYYLPGGENWRVVIIFAKLQLGNYITLTMWVDLAPLPSTRQHSSRHSSSRTDNVLLLPPALSTFPSQRCPQPSAGRTPLLRRWHSLH